MSNHKGRAESQVTGAIQPCGSEESGWVSVIESNGAKVLVDATITLVAGESVRNLNIHRADFFKGAANVLLIFRLQTIIRRAAGGILEIADSHVRVDTAKRCLRFAHSGRTEGGQKRPARIQAKSGKVIDSSPPTGLPPPAGCKPGQAAIAWSIVATPHFASVVLMALVAAVSFKKRESPTWLASMVNGKCKLRLRMKSTERTPPFTISR